MQMNNYRLGSVIDVLAAGGVEQYHVVRVQDWENLGAFLFFRKPEPGDERSHWSNPAH
jgi:hypothetical protein